MKLIKTIFALSLILLVSACDQSGAQQEATLTAEERATITAEINTMMTVVIKGLNTNDPDLIFKDFWKSDSALFVLNGNALKGYDQIIGAFRADVSQRQNTELTIHEDYVEVLGKNAALHQASFTNGMVMANDSTMTVAGHWSSLFRKINGEWKVILVHESFNPVN